MKIPFFLKKPLDNSSGIGQDSPNEAMNATEQSKKTPWFLRWPGAILAVGSLALPGGEIQAQSNSPNNSPTNSVSTPSYNNPEFGDATSREDCDRILKEVLAKIKNTTDDINAAWEKAEKCDKDCDESLNTNNLNYNRTPAEDRATVRSLFMTCMGLGVSAGAASSVSKRYHGQSGAA